MQYLNLERRFDIYANTHKALRAYMSHVLMDIGRADWRDAEDRDHALTAVRELLGVCHAHLELENTVIHPAMESRKPGCTRYVVDEHVGQLFAIDVLFDLVDTVEAASIPDRPMAGQRLYRELAVFAAQNFEHMAFEEAEHNRVLWECYSDDELRALDTIMLATVSPDQYKVMLNWMLPHLNPTERAEMLVSLKQALPLEQFQRLLGTLRGQLPSKDWGKLSAALGAM